MWKVLPLHYGLIVFSQTVLLVLSAMMTGTENVLQNGAVPSTSYDILPAGWNDFCVVNNGSSLENLYIKCTIGKQSSGQWNYSQIISYIATGNVTYNFDIECTQGANISLRWPVKALNLKGMKVKNCLLTDFYGDYENETLATFADQLEHLVLLDVMVLVDIFDLVYFAGTIVNVTQDTLCGNDETIVEIQIRNMTYNFGDSTEIFFERMFNESTGAYDFENDPVVNEGKKMFSNMLVIRHICNYKRLIIYDNSVTSHPSKFFNDIKTEGSLYPVLETLNLSYTPFGGQYSVDDILNDWAVFYPTLKVMDLSHCNVEILKVSNDIKNIDNTHNHVLHVNLTGNNISELHVPVLDTLADIERIFFNFSDNPLNCSCAEDVKELIKFVKDTSKWNKKRYKRYDFIREMQCRYPEPLNGIMLKDLEEEHLLCSNDVTLTRTIVVEAVVVLSLLSFFLLIIIFILVKFRTEIRILTYTRFHILLPFQAEEAFEEKHFDAFVSYSNADQDWVNSVFDNDSVEGLTDFKFCLHQRNFMPGRTITENIVDCIESSRHTIVIMSKNFLSSTYCLYEFEEALRQSISERNRHLLLIMLEEIKKDEMPKTLQSCLKTFTYIKKDDHIFLDRLIFSLSYKGKEQKKRALKDSGHENKSYEENNISHNPTGIFVT